MRRRGDLDTCDMRKGRGPARCFRDMVKTIGEENKFRTKYNNAYYECHNKTLHVCWFKITF